MKRIQNYDKINRCNTIDKENNNGIESFRKRDEIAKCANDKYGDAVKFFVVKRENEGRFIRSIC